jgi:DedD protein
MAKPQTQDEINIKRKARRRLIGAIALVLMVIVILPMVLDSEPKITGQDIDLRIPAPDKTGEFVPGMAASEVVDTGGASAVGEVQFSSAVQAIKPDNIDSVGDVGVLPVAPVISQTDGKTIAEKPTRILASKALDAHNTEVNQSDIKRNDNKKSDASAEKSKISPAQASVSAGDKEINKSTGSYSVQIGAFASPSAASQESEKLKSWGFRVYTEQINDTTRVRVGPYSDQNKAVEARKLLESRGLQPTLVPVK